MHEQISILMLQLLKHNGWSQLILYPRGMGFNKWKDMWLLSWIPFTINDYLFGIKESSTDEEAWHKWLECWDLQTDGIKLKRYFLWTPNLLLQSWWMVPSQPVDHTGKSFTSFLASPLSQCYSHCLSWSPYHLSGMTTLEWHTSNLFLNNHLSSSKKSTS